MRFGDRRSTICHSVRSHNTNMIRSANRIVSMALQTSNHWVKTFVHKFNKFSREQKHFSSNIFDKHPPLLLQSPCLSSSEIAIRVIAFYLCCKTIGNTTPRYALHAPAAAWPHNTQLCVHLCGCSRLLHCTALHSSPPTLTHTRLRKICARVRAKNSCCVPI